MDIRGIGEVGNRESIHPRPPPLVSQLLEMVWDGTLYLGYPLCNDDINNAIDYDMTGV